MGTVDWLLIIPRSYDRRYYSGYYHYSDSFSTLENRKILDRNT